LRYLDLERAKALDPFHLDRETIVDIWFPTIAHKVAKQFGQLHPEAKNVIEFLTGSSKEIDVLKFLDEYRAWLPPVPE
jgi:hypothetical protein